MMASKSPFLKPYEGSTQHEPLLVVSPGSLHTNSSIENIEYTKFTKVFEQLTLSVVFSALHYLASQKVSISECDGTGIVKVESS